MSLKITDLKVADLRAELEKRGLDKSGVKSILIERLRNALTDEGIDADEHEFKSTKRKNDLANSEAGDEEEMDTSENSKDISHKADDEDTPCSDEEEMDDYKHQEDTESARFKVTQSRQESSKEVDGSLTNSESSKNDNAVEAEKDVSQNETESMETSETSDAKTGKKVLKVIGKDKVQQFAVTARTLWVAGLNSTSKASDLKNLFSKHGKVTSVKIVRNTKGTQRKWFGLLTMATSKDASKCIEKLHRTEFGGHVISVERRQTAPIVKKSEAAVVKKPAPKNDAKETTTKSDKEAKKPAEERRKEPLTDNEDKSKSDDERGTPERGYRSYESRPYSRGRFRGGFRGRPFSSFRGRGMSFRGRGRFSGFRRPFGRPSPFDRPSFRSMSSRGRYRYDFDEGRGGRDYEREMRMKQDEEMFRHKIIVRKQKEEAYRLEREKNQLRLEREMLEREKAEMLKLERAKQRMEREQLEMEREKLRRQSQMSSSSKRPFIRRGGGPPHAWTEKRREAEYDGPPSNFREKFSGEGKFPYSREHSSYKKPEYMHDEFRREKMEASTHTKFAERDERREVTYHGAPERRVYSRSEFRGPGPSSSPPMKHYAPRSKPPREEWKFHERRGGEKPGYPPRGRKMGYY